MSRSSRLLAAIAGVGFACVGLACIGLTCAAFAAEPPSKVRLQGTQTNQPRTIGLVPGPPAPVLVGPASDITLTGPSVRFRWQAGAGQTNPVRYEICVTEVNQPCTGPAAAIFRPSPDAINIEPALPQPTVRPRPGQPGFGQPPMSEGSPPPTFFLQAVLPPSFKGRRLQWWVSACVPDPRPGNFRAGVTPELCTASVSRIMSWALSVPTVRAPGSNSVLSTLTDQFSWDVVDPQGIEYFLICVATRGKPCPAAPGVQPSVVVAQVPFAPMVPYTFTPKLRSLELGTMMGETLEWTVAACNAALGCSYQPARSSFQVPILDGSWDSMYAVTQDAKCQNCHQMWAENENYRRHVDLRRFTREQNPPGEFNRGTEGCRDCHTAAAGFADAWSFPSSDANLAVPRTDQRLCGVMKVDRERFLTTGSGAPHLLGDPLIHWAVDRIPGLGYAGWQQRFAKWSAAGRPCCSSPKPGGCVSEPPHGQFGFVRWDTRLSLVINNASDSLYLAFGNQAAPGFSSTVVAPGKYVGSKTPAPVCDSSAELQEKGFVVSVVPPTLGLARELFRMCQDPADDRLYVVRAGGGWQDRVVCAGFPKRLVGDLKVFVEANGLPRCETWE